MWTPTRTLFVSCVVPGLRLGRACPAMHEPICGILGWSTRNPRALLLISWTSSLILTSSSTKLVHCSLTANQNRGATQPQYPPQSSPPYWVSPPPPLPHPLHPSSIRWPHLGLGRHPKLPLPLPHLYLAHLPSVTSLLQCGSSAWVVGSSWPYHIVSFYLQACWCNMRNHSDKVGPICYNLICYD